MEWNISVIILSYNEEIHIERCINSVVALAAPVFVVDSFSSDNTWELAKQSGAVIFQNKWENNHAVQFNWALQNLPIKTEWVLRLDADEYLTDELVEEIKQKLSGLPADVSGIVLPLKRVFLGREMRYGVGCVKLMRLFKFGKAVCEQRLMDEHIELLEGKAVEFEHPFADHNLNDLSWWTQKHVGYALREALDLLDMELGILSGSTVPQSGTGSIRLCPAGYGGQVAPDGAGSKGFKSVGGGLVGQAAVKRAKKMRYVRLPLFWRSALYFFVRYVVKGGFLDGKEGFLWHFLQGWWYRALVDAKIFEIKWACGNDVNKIKKCLLDKYQIDCSKVNPFEKG